MHKILKIVLLIVGVLSIIFLARIVGAGDEEVQALAAEGSTGTSCRRKYLFIRANALDCIHYFRNNSNFSSAICICKFIYKYCNIKKYVIKCRCFSSSRFNCLLYCFGSRNTNARRKNVIGIWL